MPGRDPLDGRVRASTRPASAAWHPVHGRRTPSRATPSPTAGRVRTIVQSTSPGGAAMPGWNFAEIWEVVAEQIPDAPAQVQGDRVVHVAGVRRAGQRRRPHAARGRRAAPGQGGAVPLQLSRVPGVDVRHVQGRAASRSTPTTATPTTSSSTCGTTPTPSPSSSTARSSSTSSASATGCRRCASGCGSTTAAGPARTGPRPTRTPRPRTTGGWPAPWGRDGDDLYLLYTGGTTGMPKGVMWRQDDLVRNILAAGTNPRYGEDPVDYEVDPRAGAGARHGRRSRPAR